jgi:hypothetical protein
MNFFHFFILKFFRLTILTIFLFSPTLLNAENLGWISEDGKPIPNSDNMKSIDGFGGYLVITPDSNWKSKWNTTPETTPEFSETSEVSYGEKITVLTFFINPKIDESGNINVRCDILVKRPDGTVSTDMKDVECAIGKLQGNPHNVRLTSSIINFIGEKGDPPGMWNVEVTIFDKNKNIQIPLKSKFKLIKESKKKTVKSSDNLNSKFKSQEDFGKWLMYYYQNPEPDEVLAAVKYMSQSGLLDGENVSPPLFGFLAGVLKDNPDRVSEWIDKLTSIKESHLGIVVLGLWYANLPSSQNRVYAILDNHPSLKSQFAFLEKGSPMDVEQIPLENGAWVLDALWGKFAATGGKAPVVRIISSLPWLEVKGDVKKLMIGGAARWSLISNAEQHERVLMFCREELKTQPKDVVEKLQEVVAEASKKK